MSKTYIPLESYGVIGNLETIALVGDNGSIDWYCFPHIESPSMFGAILDSEKGGYFSIAPDRDFESIPRYLPRTNVLETCFTTSEGEASITDFMPVRGMKGTGENEHRALVRKVEGKKGTLAMKTVFFPAFDYGRKRGDISQVENGLLAVGDGLEMVLRAPVDFDIIEGVAQAEFTLSEDRVLWFVLTEKATDFESTPARLQELLGLTIDYWDHWSHTCVKDVCLFEGPWHDQAVRSGLVLKLLTHPQTGSMFAAPTTSLPEEIGGVRNWDYRFAWIRDASFTVQALYNLGHVNEAEEFLGWLRSLEEMNRPEDIRIMYGVHGERDLEEVVLDHLEGYEGSKPVRTGNAAYRQKQLDIYGELINAVYETSRYGRDLSAGDLKMVAGIADHVCRVWDKPDSGIWEIRSGPRHFTYSKLMCWLALDRGLTMVEAHHFEAPVSYWKKNRDMVREYILEDCFSKKQNSFVQSSGSEVLDATSLLIPVVEFLPCEDPRVQGTIEATLEELTTDGLVMRYNGEDGLAGGEGAFVLCTFWLVHALALSGRVLKAREIFLNVLEKASPLGLFAEEIEPVSGRQLGNFPQAFSHIGLINAALYMGVAEGRTQKGPDPIGLIKPEFKLDTPEEI